MAQWPRLKMMDSICMVRFTHILQYSRKMAKLATSSLSSKASTTCRSTSSVGLANTSVVLIKSLPDRVAQCRLLIWLIVFCDKSCDHTSGRHRKSRMKLPSTDDSHLSTTKCDGMCQIRIDDLGTYQVCGPRRPPDASDQHALGSSA